MPSNKTSYLQKEYKFEGGFSKSVLNMLWQAYRNSLGIIFLTLLTGFIGRIFILGNANIIGYWVDSFCIDSETCTPAPSWTQGLDSMDYITVLSVGTLLGFMMTFVFRVWFSRASAEAISNIYDEVTIRTSRYPISFFDTNPAGRIITRFSSDYGNVFRLFGGPLAEFFAIIFDLLAMILLISIASPYYLIPVSIIILLNFAVFKINHTRLRKARRDLSHSRSPSISHFAETTQGASSIRAFSKQDSFLERFEKLDTLYLKQKVKTSLHIMGFSLQMNMLTALLFLITGFGALYLVSTGRASVGSVGVAFAFIVLSGSTVQMFFEWMSQLEEALVGAERLDQYLRLPIEKGSFLPSHAQFSTEHPVEPPQTNTAIQTEYLKSKKALAVKFNDVWLSYDGQTPVLKGVHFEIQAGEKVGIIGKTGSGKSSIIQSLFGLYPIYKGEILIGDLSTQKSPVAEFRRHMSLIPQDPSLFQGTVRDNLDISRTLPEEKLYEVLKKIGLKEWASPEGLKIPIEERGRNLSMGEKQLICLGRCLLQDTEVVVLDEATASVDPHSEEIMMQATRDFFNGKTQIIIAHRLSTLESCHRIIWIDSGKVRQIGPPAEILSQFQRTNLAL